MIRLYLLVAAIAVAGCGSIDCDKNSFTCTGDDRPATLEYVTSTILRPYCATAGCHSAFAFVGKNGAFYRFDTYEHVRASILTPVPKDPMPVPIVDVVGCDPDSSLLYNVLTRQTGPNGEAPRMPYDEPLSAADISLVRRWIVEGEDGLGVDTSACAMVATP